MREPHSFETLSSTGSSGVTDVQVSTSYSKRSRPSVVPPSMRVGDLLKQAMSYFETDRKAALRCLSDAAALLGGDVGDSRVNVPSLKHVRRGGLASWQARQTLAYIEANLTSTIEIGDLAKVVALSISHFCRTFKQSLGLPPMAYVAVRRVERAKTLLSSTREPLAEIALACGFSDQAHFNRRFRGLVGMPPGRWRRSSMAGPQSGGAVIPP